MSEAMLIALLGFATRFGIEAAIAFFQNRGATIDDAISALGNAQEKSLDAYLAEDRARRGIPPPPPP
jgi:hypothetical protein